MKNPMEKEPKCEAFFSKEFREKKKIQTYDTAGTAGVRRSIDDVGLDTEHLVLPASHTLLHLLIPRLQRVEHSARFEPPGTRLHKLQSPQVSLQLNSPKYWQESMVLAAVNAPLK